MELNRRMQWRGCKSPITDYSGCSGIRGKDGQGINTAGAPGTSGQLHPGLSPGAAWLFRVQRGKGTGKTLWRPYS
jgi:hypothetical protein